MSQEEKGRVRSDSPKAGPPPTPVLALEQLEEATTRDGKPGAVRLASRCHDAPLFAIYPHGHGRLVLVCAWCGQATAEIPVARSLIVLPRGNGMGGGG